MTKTDTIDEQIINILTSNSRVSVTEMAKKLGLSEATVRKRMEKLEEEEIITRYTIDVDPAKLGFRTRTILGLDVEPQEFLSAAKALAEMPETRTVYTSTGDHMIMAEIWTKDIESLSRLLSGKIASVKGVKRLCPAIVLEKLK